MLARVLLPLELLEHVIHDTLCKLSLDGVVALASSRRQFDLNDAVDNQREDEQRVLVGILHRLEVAKSGTSDNRLRYVPALDTGTT